MNKNKNKNWLDSDSEIEIDEFRNQEELPVKLNNLIIDFSFTPYIDSIGVSTIITVASFDYTYLYKLLNFNLYLAS